MAAAWRRLGVLLGLVMGVAGCGGSDVTFSYFLVKVTIDRRSVDDELLGLIRVCSAEAQTARGKDGRDLCREPASLPYDLGKFEYSTTLTSGAVKFAVVLYGRYNNALARGESVEVGIVPGMTKETEVLVEAIPGAPREPGVVPGGGSDAGP